jgi:hypothetical protein
LDRDVQCADGLVKYDEVGLKREGAGDPDPLTLAAGELVRVLLGTLGGVGDADLLEQLDGSLRTRRRHVSATGDEQ